MTLCRRHQISLNLCGCGTKPPTQVASSEVMDLQAKLAIVHFRRMEAHWGREWAQVNAFAEGRWPHNDKEWRQTGHGAPWDSNVEMAKFHLEMAQRLKSEGLI